jgi:hypothetical protein
VQCFGTEKREWPIGRQNLGPTLDVLIKRMLCNRMGKPEID